MSSVGTEAMSPVVTEDVFRIMNVNVCQYLVTWCSRARAIKSIQLLEDDIDAVLVAKGVDPAPRRGRDILPRLLDATLAVRTKCQTLSVRHDVTNIARERDVFGVELAAPFENDGATLETRDEVAPVDVRLFVPIDSSVANANVAQTTSTARVVIETQPVVGHRTQRRGRFNK